MRNALCIFGLRFTMKIRNMFVDIFVTLYLWNLSNGSIPVLCKYYNTFVICILFTMLICAPKFSKRKLRKHLLMFAVVMQLMYLILIYSMGTACVDRVILIAAFSGISCGMYYSVYNLYEAEGVDNESRHKFLGRYQVIDALACVGFPIVSGYLIQKFGMDIALISVMVITVISFVFAAAYNDNGSSLSVEFSFRNMLKALHTTDNGELKLKTSLRCCLVRGMTVSYGSFELFISVWTMIAFTTALKVGSMSGVGNAFRILFGLIFARFGMKIHKQNIAVFYVLRIMTVVAIIVTALTGSVASLIMISLAFKCSGAVDSPVHGCALQTIVNSGDLSKYKSEFYLCNEHALTLARVAGYSLLWVWGYIGSDYMLAVCVVVYSVLLLLGPATEDRLYRLAYKVD